VPSSDLSKATLIKACVGLAIGALILSACGSTAAPSTKVLEPSATGIAAATATTAASTPAATPSTASPVAPPSPVTALGADLIGPIGLAFDMAGNLYVSECDPANSDIRRIDPNGIMTTFAGKTSGYSGDGGPAISAELFCPLGMAFGPDGAMYFADHGNNRIRRIDTAGIIATIAGSGQTGIDQGSFAGDGGPAVEARLQEPYGVAVDRVGNVYVSDRDNNRIRKIDAKGIISTIAGDGHTGFSRDGVLGSQTSIELPLGVTVDALGDVLFADADNKRVRMIDRHGVITTIAGSGKNAATGDGGLARKAALADPENLAFDASGNLYVTDTVSDRLRRIDGHGIITTLASNRGGNGLAIDRGGNLYVTNLDSKSVYRIDTKGVVALFAGRAS
jgi:sugar lactone lactonase YvrE